MALHIHLHRDAATKQKFNVGQVITSGQSFENGPRGQQIPTEKIIVTGYFMKNGQTAVTLDLYYSPDVQKKWDVPRVSKTWAYEDEVR